MLTL
ncbi:hypothetical protein PENSTE_c043G06622 [Penicillium steckii]|jgi:hypothetical protein